MTLLCAGNLKILSGSLLDALTLESNTVPAVNYPLSNLQLPQASSKWRSQDASMQQIMCDLVTQQPVSGFTLNAHNMDYTGTIRLALYKAAQRGLTMLGTTSIGTGGAGEQYNVSFSEAHGIPVIKGIPVVPEDEHYVHAVQLIGANDVAIYECAYISATIVAVRARGTEFDDFDFGNGDAGISLLTQFDETKEAVPSTFGWGEQPWGQGGWYGMDNSLPKPTDVTFWFDLINADFMRVDLVDPVNSVGYIEAGRIMLGQEFSPRYNMEYGNSVDYQSATTVTRTRSGSLISDNHPSYRNLEFQFNHLSEVEGMVLLGYMNNPANKSDALVSMFPDNMGSLGLVTTVLGRFLSHSPLSRNKEGYAMQVSFSESL